MRFIFNAFSVFAKRSYLGLEYLPVSIANFIAFLSVLFGFLLFFSPIKLFYIQTLRLILS